MAEDEEVGERGRGGERAWGRGGDGAGVGEDPGERVADVLDGRGVGDVRVEAVVRYDGEDPASDI